MNETEIHAEHANASTLCLRLRAVAWSKRAASSASSCRVSSCLPRAWLLFPLLIFISSVSAVTPQVAASYIASTYALANDGTVLAFGDDSYGQLGTGRILNSSVPIQIAGLDHVRDVAAGQGSVFAIKENGTVWAWGGNRNGTLADGTTLDRASPVQVRSLTGVRAISVGADSVLALKADGTVWVWGYDGYDPTSRQPVQVHGISNVIAISNREYHKVALKSDGTVWTWGFNESGQLGLAWISTDQG